MRANRANPNGKIRNDMGSLCEVQNDRGLHHFGRKGDKGVVVSGCNQKDKLIGPGDKKRYSWREKGKWKIEADTVEAPSVSLDPGLNVNPT